MRRHTRMRCTHAVHLPTGSVHNIALLGQCQSSVPPNARRGPRHDDAAALVHRVLLAHSKQQQRVKAAAPEWPTLWQGGWGRKTDSQSLREEGECVEGLLRLFTALAHCHPLLVLVTV